MKLIIIGGVIITAVLAVLAAISNRLKIRRYTVKSPKVKKPFCAVHLTDLHESVFGKGQSGLLGAVKSVSPDVILITGDMVEDENYDPIEGKALCAKDPAGVLFKGLSDIAPVYMVFGNHESNIPRTDRLCADIEALGIRVLHRHNPRCADMTEDVEICGTRVRICGADDPYFDRKELKKKHRTVSERIAEDSDVRAYDKEIWRKRLRDQYVSIKNEESLTLLLSHRPEEYGLYGELSFDAVFSGHAHGGQWRLPPIINGLYAPHQGFFPKHAGGVYMCTDTVHIVSRGLSKKRFVRIFNRPEIWVVDFVSQK